jgi:hypothetical protein
MSVSNAPALVAGARATNTDMTAAATPATPPDVQNYVVLRAICMAGQRVEPGAVVALGKQLHLELSAARKVSIDPLVPDEAATAARQTRARKPAAAPVSAPAAADVAGADPA